MKKSYWFSMRKTTLSILFFHILIISMIASGKVNAEPQTLSETSTTQLAVTPISHATQKLEKFNVQVSLDNIVAGQRLIGAQFWLHYNATLLTVLNATEGSFLGQFRSAQTAPYTFFTQIVENETIKVGILILPNSTQQGGEWTVFPQGNGTLATITFQGIYRGLYPQKYNCTLALTHIVLIDDSLSSIDILPPINGFYEILPTSPSTISLAANPATIEFGSEMTLSGVLSPNRTSANISIYSRPDANVWSWLTTAKTNSSGGFAYHWTPETVGRFEIKANWTGDETTLPSETPVTSFMVTKIVSGISLYVNPQTIALGSNVTLTGSISPIRTSAIVTISYRISGDQWSGLPEVQTDSNGQYSYSWKPSQAGSFEIKASWQGDDNTLSAESISKSVNVQAPSDVFLYAVIVAVVIIAAALITVVLFYRRTRKSEQTD